MKPALLLIDLQNDFLAAPDLQPAAGAVVDRAAALLEACRRRSIPVLHVHTTVRRNPDNRMPHWRAADDWRCAENTPGHAPPDSLQPRPDEPIFHKQFFSPFDNPDLAAHLRELQCDTLILAGVHLHGCIRAAALDAYSRGFQLLIADDAVASDDPIHAAITRRYLGQRMAKFLPVTVLQEHLNGTLPIRRIPALDLSIARRNADSWRMTTLPQRIAALEKFAALLLANAETLAQQITADVGKPITQSRGEVRRSAELIHAVIHHAPSALEFSVTPESRIRYQPLGLIAVITPWNNPIAIPVGKIAPALLYGNGVVWKPAPAAIALAQRMSALMREAASDDDVSIPVDLVGGDHTIAAHLAEHPLIDALTLSGSLRAGYALQELCARRHIPYQAELGGNNAAIAWSDADLSSSAAQIAHGAFAFAGQRCTANRRAIVPTHLLEPFAQLLTAAAAALPFGDPLDPRTVVGPLLTPAHCDHVAALLARAQRSGLRLITPHPAAAPSGRFHPPTIVIAPDPSHEIVQEETFGPVLVLQPAENFDHALTLLNGVRQGLIAALFSPDPALQQKFLASARAGVLKLNRTTADADALSPLGGWKASGLGPPEHGPSDREFFTRTQTLYLPPPTN